jgi:hypothetical protein
LPQTLHAGNILAAFALFQGLEFGCGVVNGHFINLLGPRAQSLSPVNARSVQSETLSMWPSPPFHPMCFVAARGADTCLRSAEPLVDFSDLRQPSASGGLEIGTSSGNWKCCERRIITRRLEAENRFATEVERGWIMREGAADLRGTRKQAFEMVQTTFKRALFRVYLCSADGCPDFFADFL